MCNDVTFTLGQGGRQLRGPHVWLIPIIMSATLISTEVQESGAAKQTVSNLMYPSRTVMDLVCSFIALVES
jgi:hypothetical protein